MKQIPRTPTQPATTSPVTHPATWQLLLCDLHSKKRVLFPSSVWSSGSHRLSLQLHHIHITFSTTAALQRGKDVQRQRRTVQPKPLHCKPSLLCSCFQTALGTALLNWAWIVPMLGHRAAESLAAPCDFTKLCTSPGGEHQAKQDSSQLCQMAQQSMRMALGQTAKDSTLPENRSTTNQHLTHSTAASTSPKLLLNHRNT